MIVWKHNTLKHQDMHACGCIGPQNGDPLCPCMMRSVEVKDGRYVRVQDLGPVRSKVDSAALKHCTECGRVVGSFDNYCGNCGAKLGRQLP